MIFISTLMNYEYIGNRKNRSKGNIIMGLREDISEKCPPVHGEGEELQIAAQIRGGFGNLQMKLAVTGNIKHRTGFIHLPVGRVRQ